MKILPRFVSRIDVSGVVDYSPRPLLASFQECFRVIAHVEYPLFCYLKTSARSSQQLEICALTARIGLNTAKIFAFSAVATGRCIAVAQTCGFPTLLIWFPASRVTDYEMERNASYMKYFERALQSFR